MPKQARELNILWLLFSSFQTTQHNQSHIMENTPKNTRPSFSLNKKRKAELIEMIEALKQTQKQQKDTIVEMQKRLLELQSSDKKYQKELEDLRASMAQKTAELEQNLDMRQSLEQQKMEIEEQYAQLQRELVSASSQEEILSTEKTSKSKSSFRIDMYHPGQGHYRGKIKKMLSKESEPFSGVDKEKIYDFIHKHLPDAKMNEGHRHIVKQGKNDRNISEPAESKQESSKVKELIAIQEEPKELVLSSAKNTSKSIKPVNSYPSLPTLSHLQAMNIELNIPRAQMSSSQELKIRLQLSEEELQASAGINYCWTAEVYANSFQGQGRISLGSSSQQSFEQASASIKVPSHTLTQGTFRLEAVVNYFNQQGSRIPMTSFKEGDLIFVS